MLLTPYGAPEAASWYVVTSGSGFIGHIALVVGLAAFVGSAGASLAGRIVAGRRALTVAAAALAAATGALTWALLTGDYTLAYVADATSRAMSWPYRLSSLWGGMAGSLLLWSALLAAFGAGAAFRLARPPRSALAAPAQALTAAVGAALTGMLLGLADPFASLAVPAIDGRGLTPVLEHPAMLYHPVLLYLGQTAFVVPFAVTVAALARGPQAADRTWLAFTRRSALVGWVLLSVGMLAGANWAYRELGWGGFWAWDPVEDGSLLPWLAATAFLHSAAVSARRGRVRATTAGLALASFALVLFGGYLSRSGATGSVHSFAEAGDVGRAFAGLAVAAAAGSGWLLLRRRRALGEGWQPRSWRSREAALLANIGLLVALAVIVLAGTLAPLVLGWGGEDGASVSPRFYAAFAAPVGLALLALSGLGLRMPWAPRRERSSPRPGRWVGIGGVAGGMAAGVMLGLRSPLALVATAAAGTSLLALGRTALARRTAGVPRSALVAHAGLVLLLVGVFGSTQDREVSAQVAKGQATSVGPYRLVNTGIEQRPGPRRSQVRVRLEVERSGRALGVLRPGLDRFEGKPAPLAETALRSTWRDDLLVSIEQIDPATGEVVIRAFHKPLVAWVWIGGLLMVAGGAVALYGDGGPSRSRRLRSSSRPTVSGGTGPRAA